MDMGLTVAWSFFGFFQSKESKTNAG